MSSLKEEGSSSPHSSYESSHFDYQTTSDQMPAAGGVSPPRSGSEGDKAYSYGYYNSGYNSSYYTSWQQQQQQQPQPQEQPDNINLNVNVSVNLAVNPAATSVDWS